MGTLAGRRVLVTGGSGFLGRPVCSRLQAAGVGELVVPRRRESDLTDRAAVHKLFAHARPEVVIHLAAEVGGIGANRGNPGRLFYANMAMGLNIIEEARLHEVSKLVQVGTVCSYPRLAPVPFTETDLWNGYPEETNAPYGVAKKALAVMLRAYRDQYAMNGVCVLPTNLYGPGDNFDLRSGHVIAAVIRKCEEARRSGTDHITCWGSGNVSREFLYVEDCADAVVLAAERLEDPDPVNIGGGAETTIREIVSMIARESGFAGEIRWDPAQPDGQPRRSLDTRRAVEQLGFRASTPLDEGIRTTIAWYRENAL
jgi:GDP-L-fucose synthase